jgi:hypothetical protein
MSKGQVRTCYIQARGVRGTELDISGEQTVDFTIRHKDYFTTFERTFAVDFFEVLYLWHYWHGLPAAGGSRSQSDHQKAHFKQLLLSPTDL